ncbi:MAG: SMC-Scp complex subunit ScpB [Pedosphaera sp.]|nr:SMC-Scp complex subunit ScpB [Pedosphaera sp.]
MELKLILEALLFNSQRPLQPSELRELLRNTAAQSDDEVARSLKSTKEADIIAALEELEKEHGALGRSHRLMCVAGAWQFASQPEYAPWLKTLVGAKNRPTRLSQPALETIAIVAYRQPITRAEIEQVRGVAVDGVVATLVERGLIEQVGRAEVVGRPITYGTTSVFLEYFGLRDLDQLPAADELRRIIVQKPEALLTTDPETLTTAEAEGSKPPEGLATAPPAAVIEGSSESKPATTSEDPSSV